MRVIIRIVLIDVRLVLCVKIRLFLRVAGGVFGGGVEAAALALVVVGFGAGGEHVVQPLLPEFEAIIHIVIRHRKLFFVQPACRAVERGFGHQAGPGDRHVILRRDQAVEIPHRRARVALVAVPG